MDRQQRRRNDRLVNWVKTLSADKQAILSEVINSEIDKKIHATLVTADTAISASLFENTELSVNDVDKILERSKELIKDSKIYIEKYKEDWIMKFKEVRPEIVNRAVELLNKNKSQADGVKILKNEFKEIPLKDLVNTWKETKEAWCKATIPKTTKVVEDVKKVEKVEPVVEDKPKEEPIKSTLTIVNKILEVKGEFNNYKITNNQVVTDDGLEFNSCNDIAEYYKKQFEELNNRINELKQVMEIVI